MMTQREYAEWWCDLPDDLDTLDEPVRTLVQHVSVLQDRIYQLPGGCGCAYDHPADVCMVHAPVTAKEDT